MQGSAVHLWVQLKEPQTENKDLIFKKWSFAPAHEEHSEKTLFATSDFCIFSLKTVVEVWLGFKDLTFFFLAWESKCLFLYIHGQEFFNNATALSSIPLPSSPYILRLLYSTWENAKQAKGEMYISFCFIDDEVG